MLGVADENAEELLQGVRGSDLPSCRNLASVTLADMSLSRPRVRGRIRNEFLLCELVIIVSISRMF